MEALPPVPAGARRAWESDRVLFAVLIAMATANALLWAFTIPFNEAPDEAAHFQVVRFILDHGRLPVFRPDELWLINTSKGWVESYAPFPPLTYMVGALASRLTDGTMWGARLVSSVSYVATVALTFLIAQRLVPNGRAVAVCAALVVAFLPQFAFTAAYVNSDAIGVSFTTLLLYLLLRLRAAQSSFWLMLAIGVAAGALLLTKYTFYPAAAIGVAVAAWHVRRWSRLISLAGGLAVTAGWWFARNWILYGEVVPVRVIADAKAAAGGNTLFVPADYGITLFDISTRTDFWWASFTSFVGKFGFISIELHPAYYVVCLALAAVALAGALARLFRSRPRLQDLAPIGVGTAIAAGTALFAMYSSSSGEYSPQGRYLFAALVPIAIGLVGGLSCLGSLAPVLRIVPIGATLGFVALNFVALFGYVVPAHFGDGARQLVVQLDPVRAGPGSSVELGGWALVQATSTWRPYSPAAVADYREPVSEVRIYEGGPPPGGQLVGTARYGLKRADVADFYGGFRSLEDVGYHLDIPLEALRGPDRGIYVCASGPLGKAACATQTGGGDRP